MAYAILASLAGVWLWLLATGSGIFVWTLGTAAVALSALWAGAWLWLRQRGDAVPAPSFLRVERAFLALLLFLLMTACPLPLSALRLHGAERAAQDRSAATALGTAHTLGIAPRVSRAYALTRNRAGTLRIALLAVAAFCAGSLTAGLGRRQRVALLGLLVAGGAVAAVLGYIGQWVRPQGYTLWWRYPVPPCLPGPVAGFVNRNHFAGFLAVLAAVALGLTFYAVARRRWLAAPLAMAACGVMTAVVFFSLSRGAMLACVAGLVVVLAGALRGVARAPAVGSACLALLMVGWLPADRTQQVRERLDTLREPLATESAHVRLSAWRDSLAIWRHYPVVGAGANAFRTVFPQFRRTSYNDFMTHPENEYVQVAAETGVVGVALALWLALALWRQRDRREETRWLRLGVGGALAAAAVHACFDFAPHVPLYTVTLAMLVGAVQPAWRGAPEGTPTQSLPASAWLAPLVALLLAPDSRALERLDQRTALMSLPVRDVAQALNWAPTSWHAWYYLGRHACLAGTPEGFALGEHCLAQAARYDPNNYPLWLELGKLRLHLGQYDGARTAFARVRALRTWVPLPKVPEGARP